MSRRKKWLIAAFSIVVAAVVAAAGAAYYLVLCPMLHIQTPTYIYIDDYDTYDSVVRKIEREGNAQQLYGLELIAKYYHYDKKIKTGKYALQPGDNALTLTRRLVSGQQTPVKLVIPSVRTLDRLAQTVSKQLMMDSLTLIRILTDSVYCSDYGYTPQTICCMFIPNTYQVYWNVSPQKFLERMQKEHDRFWTNERLEQATAIGLSADEVTTLASIVEEETANDQEKPIVAGLYMNRLQKGMLLQADPTVKFALQDFTLRRILNVHLETDSPYNTYKYEGLPPGPIRIPTIKGIEGVLHYTHHNYLYMCAKEDFSGTHNFASSLSQHLQNARKYQQALNNRGIR